MYFFTFTSKFTQNLYQNRNMKLAIIKERKNPPDRRVVFSPEACANLLKAYPDLEIEIESSDVRVFSDEAYRSKGLIVVDDISNSDVLLGVKEVPIDALIPNKSYFFFSHTFKKQSYNRKLLRAILDKKIELYDHEAITNTKEIRTVAFGRYAGIVGAYNGFRTYGLKFDLFELPKAENLNDQADLISKLKEIKDKLPNIKIAVTGKGKVSSGVLEMLIGMELKQVSPKEYLEQIFSEPVFTQLGCLDYVIRKDGKDLGVVDFYNNATEYKSNFMRFAKITDLYVSAHFYGTGAPYIYTREDAKSPDFNIKVVADVSCDIDGPVASTIRPSTIADPIYGYDAKNEKEANFKDENVIAVMAVDNLPCELPNDASVGFGKMFAEHVTPAFFNNDADGVLQRARMTTKEGKLTKRFSYLQDYVDGKE